MPPRTDPFPNPSTCLTQAKKRSVCTLVHLTTEAPCPDPAASVYKWLSDTCVGCRVWIHQCMYKYVHLCVCVHC